MKIIGHRGAKDVAPENTLASINKAIELGVAMVEIDLQVCAFGELVVIHDDSVDRTTNGTGPVREQTLAKLRMLDAGKGERISTLQEVIDVVDQRVGLIIELKVSEAVDPVIKIIKNYLAKGWFSKSFFISSYNHYDLLESLNQLPHIERIPIFAGIPIGYTEFVSILKPSSIAVEWDTINKKLVDHAHAQSIEVFAFTINDMHSFEYVQKLGVDGIVTDNPELFL